MSLRLQSLHRQQAPNAAMHTMITQLTSSPLRVLGVSAFNVRCSGLILSASSCDARQRSKPFTSPANTCTQHTHHVWTSTHCTQYTHHVWTSTHCTQYYMHMKMAANVVCTFSINSGPPTIDAPALLAASAAGPCRGGRRGTIAHMHCITVSQ